MTKDLQRDLGLYAVFTISVGAMVGSGIFVLPGLAAGIAGPAVVLAYLLAGLVVLPAALSKAEMATAMPESGGTYLFIDRAMGPMLGTVAGLGAWFSLVFKSAFALVGLGAYLVLLAPLPTRPVALAIAVVLVAVNVLGVKESGRLQAAIVSVVLLSLLAFILDGITFVEQTRYHPFFGQGSGSVLAATGFVFVSYAGVTKVASVAEEVESPGRYIPFGMLGSVVFMMLVYSLVIFVVVGTTPPSALTGTKTPMADAATGLFGGTGGLIMVAVAVLALTSMANAGILSSSRFPLAMSRDDLAPPRLRRIHGGYRTPVVAILVTGGLLVTLIATLPILQLAKLASAFKILVFVFVNVALVAFREADLDWYDPPFESPGYPWVQLFGIGGGLVLLTQMGPLPLAGAVGIVALGLVWYRVYGRERTEREGAAVAALRQTSRERATELTERAMAECGPERVLLALDGTLDDEEEATMLRLAADAVRDGGVVHVALFEAVPSQTQLSAMTVEQTASEVAFEERTAALAADLDATVEAAEIVAHDRKRAVMNFAAAHDVDLVVGEWERDLFGPEFLDTDVDWFIEHCETDLAFVHDRTLATVDRVALVADRGPYDPLEVVLADRIATRNDADLEFVYAQRSAAGEDEAAAVDDYHETIEALCRAPTSFRVIETDDRLADLEAAVADADLVVVGTTAHNVLFDVLVGAVPDRLADRLDSTVVLTHTQYSPGRTLIRSVIDWLVH